MKKLFVALVMIAMGMVSCAHRPTTYTYNWWVKEGVSEQQTLDDQKECKAPRYIREDMTSYDEDLDTCRQAAVDRATHKSRIVEGVGWGAVIPFAGVLAPVASAVLSVSIPNSDICGRCMAGKSYKENPDYGSNQENCMKEKGYEWKEITETK